MYTYINTNYRFRNGYVHIWICKEYLKWPPYSKKRSNKEVQTEIQIINYIYLRESDMERALANANL